MTKIRFSFIIVLCIAFFVLLPVIGHCNDVVQLGFPIMLWDTKTTKINLVKDDLNNSAFLKQIRRQAVLVAARDELGVGTRDAFLGELAPDGAVSIADIDAFPDAGAESGPEYADHRKFVQELEKRSRKEFVENLEKLGVKRASLPTPAIDKPDEEKEIDVLLHDWSIVPQFEAVRRTHELIRRHGETPARLTRLVRAYTQLQMMTNCTARDTHRVFQARSILYSQRLVAKHGETPEHLSLRAATWSLNDFHRIAREEFAALKKTDDNYVELARTYADFDFKELDRRIAASDGHVEQPLAKLLRFKLLDFTNNPLALTRPYAETIIADLPDCEYLYHRAQSLDTFDIFVATDGSPFFERLARAPKKLLASRGITPDADEANSGILGNYFAAPTVHGLSTEKHFKRLADLLKMLRETESGKEVLEPSDQVLATLLEDREFQTVSLLVDNLSGRNGVPEDIVLPAEVAIGSHPAFFYLGDYFRAPEAKAAFLRRPKPETMPYEFLSVHCIGFKNMGNTQFKGEVFIPFYIARFFLDRENVRDILSCHQRVTGVGAASVRYFTTDLLLTLCPNNPYAIGEDIYRNGTSFDDERVALLLRDYPGFPCLYQKITSRYRKDGEEAKALPIDRTEFAAFPSRILAYRLVEHDLARNAPDEAVAVFKEFLGSPEANRRLIGITATQDIGKILLQQGKFKEAGPYFFQAAQSNSSWGLGGFAMYLEIIGRFEMAEKVWEANVASYPEKGPFDRWGLCFRTNGENLKLMTGEILDRYEYFSQAAPEDEKTRLKYKTEDRQILYPCYCMDVPTPESLGTVPFRTEMYREANGLAGFLAYFAALDKKDSKAAAIILEQLRGEIVVGKNPFLGAQRQKPGWTGGYRQVDKPYRMLAALLEQDQRQEKPGTLRDDELNFVLRSVYSGGLDTTYAQTILYVLGRYYAACGEKERATAMYRRALGFRTNIDFTRSLVVKELRKDGLTNEEYLELSMGDPQWPQGKMISNDTADIFCRLLFRDYSDSPAATQLATPSATEPPPAAPDFGESIPFKKTSWYRASRILFHGRVIPAAETVVWVSAYPRDYWNFSGTGTVDAMEMNLGEQGPDGVYPIRLGRKNPLNALASFHKDHLVLVICLDPKRKPESLTPPPDSDCIRIECDKR